MRILVVDDDPQILSLLRRGLIYEGYTVDTAADGNEALGKALDIEPDLVVLDLMLPGKDGLLVSKELRQRTDVPILMLTARSSVADKVEGLKSGADDYMVKPFAFEELAARIAALLRRRQANEILRFADLSLDLTSREVKCGNRYIELSPQEFDLLELFMRNPRRVLTRDQILERVWNDLDCESNVIEVYVKYLRSKLEADGHPRLIHTVRSVGYILKDGAQSACPT